MPSLKMKTKSTQATSGKKLVSFCNNVPSRDVTGDDANCRELLDGEKVRIVRQPPISNDLEADDMRMISGQAQSPCISKLNTIFSPTLEDTSHRNELDVLIVEGIVIAFTCNGLDVLIVEGMVSACIMICMDMQRETKAHHMHMALSPYCQVVFIIGQRQNQDKKRKTLFSYFSSGMATPKPTPSDATPTHIHSAATPTHTPSVTPTATSSGTATPTATSSGTATPSDTSEFDLASLERDPGCTYDFNESASLPDYKCDEPSVILDEELMLMPFLKDFFGTSNSYGGRVCENTTSDFVSSSLCILIHQLQSYNQEPDAKTHQNWDKVDYLNIDMFIRTLKDVSDITANPWPTNVLPIRTKKRRSTTLVLDLDETLVHSTLDHCVDADFTFPVYVDTEEHIVYVNKRPFLHTFLERVADMFEIVIFTSSKSIYAKQLLDTLDPDQNIISRAGLS
ncbi:hypothetical protein POM88_019827 [Heracleum sosnowskyi]|uniref:Mitochondrial import inner membrane translocase subunit TIM50 n=1 Tax=Heracleum sosnowskyi TaxID=360622 RepID=A0AAD8ICN5_9APIA|nr:hypothetical protein POM88_019827 [Heracleum sosnowskyi]